MKSFRNICHGLRNVTFTISPSIVQRGSNVTMMCHYDVESSTLYAVKWYRGTFEFYRYVPKEKPSQKIFLVYQKPIRVDTSKSNSSQVVLRDVSFGLAGNYSCEVTTDEGPNIKTAVDKKELQVVDLPESGPVILLDKARYEPGDQLIANCTLPPSKPPANLTFYINNIVIENLKTQYFPRPEQLTWSLLVVNLTLLTSHFNEQQNALLLRCSAVIDTLFQNSTTLSFTYRKEPIPERVITQNAASQRIYDSTLSLSPIFVLIIRKKIMVV